jgi:putative oxidoreductase
VALSKESFANLGLLVMRAGLGAQMALYHGADKLRHFSDRVGSYPDPLNIGHRNSLLLTVAAEFVCSILLVLGLASRLAALALSFVMGVALFVQQAPEPWRKKELGALYFAGFLTMLFLGPGRLSLDAILLPRLFKRGGSGASARGAAGARMAAASR